MSKSKFNRPSSTPKISKIVTKPKRNGGKDSPKSLPGKPAAFIGPGMKCKGVMTSDGQMQIDGSIEGEIHAKGTVMVGEEGTVFANVQADSVISHGQISGDVTAQKNIHLMSSAVVKGSVNTPYLSMEEGAILETDWSLWINGARIPGQVWNKQYQRGTITHPSWWKAAVKDIPCVK